MKPDSIKHGHSAIHDPLVLETIKAMNARRKHPDASAFSGPEAPNPEVFADYGFSIHPEQGELIYLLCRAMKATRVVDFATSVGMSAIYFAAAMRDNGGGQVIGAELVAAKAETAHSNLTAARLESFVDIRVGDARTTLKDVGGPVDFVLIDGWPLSEGPTLARQIIEIMAPQLRVGDMCLTTTRNLIFLTIFVTRLMVLSLSRYQSSGVRS